MSFPWRKIAIVFVATGVAYAPALRGGFVWDDDAHVTKTALRSLSGLGRIWAEFGATQQYYPVLHSAFWVEHRLWGDHPVGYHLLNVLLHALAACLFAAVIETLRAAGEKGGEAAAVTVKESGEAAASTWPWIAGFLFALHPVEVESVAWISEQKNTLSAVFALAAALVYLRWTAQPRVGRYWVATGLFVLALLTKSVTATVPAALLVVAWYRQGRLRWRADVLPLAPWLGLGAAMGLVTAWYERAMLGASGSGFELSGLERGMLAGRVAWFYLGKLLWPVHLLFVYPHWTVSSAEAWQFAFPVALAATLAALGWLAARGRRGPLAAALIFGGLLFPALGFFNVYPFLFSYVADHFQYLASLAVFALAAAGWEAWRRRDPSWRPVGAAVAVLVLLAGLTAAQCRNYRDAETLYRSVLARNPGCWMAEYNLGVTLHREGRVPEAAACYERALALCPDFPQAQNNLGVILTDGGRGGEAVPHLEAAVAGYRRNPRLAADGAEAEGNLGRALQQNGRDSEAVDHFAKALAVEADRSEWRNNYAVALIRTGRMDDAQRQFETALRIHPDDATARQNLALLLSLRQRSAGNAGTP